MATLNDRRDENTVRVTNLPEETTDADLRDLFSRVGRVQRIYLAKDKQTMRSKVDIVLALFTSVDSQSSGNAGIQKLSFLLHPITAK